MAWHFANTVQFRFSSVLMQFLSFLSVQWKLECLRAKVKAFMNWVRIHSLFFLRNVKMFHSFQTCSSTRYQSSHRGATAVGPNCIVWDKFRRNRFHAWDLMQIKNVSFHTFLSSDMNRFQSRLSDSLTGFFCSGLPWWLQRKLIFRIQLRSFGKIITQLCATCQQLLMTTHFSWYLEYMTICCVASGRKSELPDTVGCTYC